ncbi:TonB-dependent receptor [Dyella mobilis]|uniref:TonB-dependent receptor n=1 Tax=Dyella mobilis TaxID=1849582 RepID=A0ABS2KIS9_9GAMM|nr:TonB-dependent receptor [Dyella mobilis]MBM7131079.1 TonB-dependent receptor [Dyella mobilis]GLQ97706.1 TonB-dependent receptor [Dyella mobilis]
MRIAPRINALAALPLAVLASSVAMAQSSQSEPVPGKTTTSKNPVTLNAISVTAQASHPAATTPAYPATQVSVTAAQMDDTVNALDVEDAAKYLPSVFIRKRNEGDTQPVLATRDWGVNSSARTLVYVDDIPISALIANNNTIGAPRWGMVSPDDIDHVDMLYGPFSAAYPGNAMGGVMRIVTRTPDKPEVTIEQTEALQTFNLYGTRGNYATSKTSVTASGRNGRFSWFVGANSANSFSQPLSFITSGSIPAHTNGAIPALNKVGQPANVLGAGGLLHTRMLNLDGKFAYDITPWLQAAYWVGYWSNDGQSRNQTYLSSASGVPTYGKASGFASNTYVIVEHHLMQAASLKTDTKGNFDGSLVITHYNFIKDDQWSPYGVLAGTTFTPNGLLASYAGTNWSTADLQGTWRPEGYGGEHEVSAGVHADQYTLANPTYGTRAWQDPDNVSGLYSAGSGKTRTNALWLQDAWQWAPDWLATIGGRFERWQASDGFNFSGKTAVYQPMEKASGFSPKATVRWDVSPAWRLTGSVAKSLRFPTVGELYQLVSTGSTFTSPNPNLKPERDLSGELAVERALDDGSVRLSLFQENTRNALIAQTSTLPAYAVPVTYTMNVGEVRNRGIELAAQQNNVLLEGLELSGSVTFVDSTILSDPNFVSAAGTTADGKHVPYVPRWRATAVATYRPDAAWAFTLAGRYSGKQYSTLDNTDDTPNVFGAFDRFLVFDARVNYRINEQWSASLGVDNLNNEKYFLYHPFPQRTYVASLKLKL